MIATLRLRAVGDQIPAAARAHAPGGLVRLYDRAARRARYVVPDRPWVARRTGLPGRAAREFLRPRRDYADATGNGAASVWLVYELREGEEYEVHEVLDWNRTRRYRARAEAGRVVEVAP